MEVNDAVTASKTRGKPGADRISKSSHLAFGFSYVHMIYFDVIYSYGHMFIRILVLFLA